MAFDNDMSFGDGQGDGALTAAEGERSALAQAEKAMMEIERIFPEWFALYEDIFPDSAPRAEFVELLKAAPNEFARGMLYGKYLMRLEIAAITKRPWN